MPKCRRPSCASSVPRTSRLAASATEELVVLETVAALECRGRRIMHGRGSSLRIHGARVAARAS
jgi:hypothetical protein